VWTEAVHKGRWRKCKAAVFWTADPTCCFTRARPSSSPSLLPFLREIWCFLDSAMNHCNCLTQQKTKCFSFMGLGLGFFCCYPLVFWGFLQWKHSWINSLMENRSVHCDNLWSMSWHKMKGRNVQLSSSWCWWVIRLIVSLRPYKRSFKDGVSHFLKQFPFTTSVFLSFFNTLTRQMPIGLITEIVWTTDLPKQTHSFKSSCKFSNM